MADLTRKLNSVGKECFVSFLPVFQDVSISDDKAAEIISQERNYSLVASRIRVSSARSIIRDGLLEDALRLVANSGKVRIVAREKALALLDVINSGGGDLVDVIDINQFKESFVIHFGGDFTRINAYTLATTLVSLANAAKSANSIINPGYEVEVVVESIGSGSFKAQVKTLYRGIGNLFTTQDLKPLVISVLAAYIAHSLFPTNVNINVVVTSDNVVLEQGDKKIIIPKNVHAELEKVRGVSRFRDEISRTFDVVEKDKNIEFFGVAKKITDKEPSVKVVRDDFPLFVSPVVEQGNSKQIIEVVDLVIMKAILERSKRKWEFVWRGVKISAPVLDNRFYDDFFARKITIAPGDSLSVKLKIYQVRDSDAGIFTNERYEIIEVLDHVPRAVQMALNMELSDDNAVLRKLRLDD